MTLKELKSKYLKSCNVGNKLLLRLGIAKIIGFKQNLETNKFWVDMKFNYWNPLTYIHLISMFIYEIPSFFYCEKVEDILYLMKTELTEGFGEWIE